MAWSIFPPHLAISSLRFGIDDDLMVSHLAFLPSISSISESLGPLLGTSVSNGAMDDKEDDDDVDDEDETV